MAVSTDRARDGGLVRIWSSAADAPRLRRPTDVILLVASVLALGLLALAAPGPTGADDALDTVLAWLEPVFGWLWSIVYAVLTLWAVGVVLLAAAEPGTAPAARRPGDRGCPGLRCRARARSPRRDRPVRHRRRAWSPPDPRPSTSRPGSRWSPRSSSRPRRTWPGRGGTRAGSSSAWAPWPRSGWVRPTSSGRAPPSPSGSRAAAVAHLVLGSPQGRLTDAQVQVALADLGVPATRVTAAPGRLAAENLLVARTERGTDLLVKVYGRDAWDSQVVGSLWTALTRRGERAHVWGTRRSRVEHEALVTLLAAQAGVPTLDVVAVGMADQGDALLVTSTPRASLRLLERRGGGRRAARRHVAGGGRR